MIVLHKGLTTKIILYLLTGIFLALIMCRPGLCYLYSHAVLVLFACGVYHTQVCEHDTRSQRGFYVLSRLMGRTRYLIGALPQGILYL